MALMGLVWRATSLALVLLASCRAASHDDTSDAVRAARLLLSADGTRTDTQISALLARAPIPVLAPTDRTLQAPTLSVGREYASLTGRESGTTVHVQATRAAHAYAGLRAQPGSHELRGTKGFVSVNEGIRTASWIENEVAYSVDVECAAADDARCQDDRYLLDLVAHLVVVGGPGT